MRFEQTRTILQKLAPQYHRTVSDHYQQLADGGVEALESIHRRKTGELIGFEVDLVGVLAASMGVKPKLVVKPFAELLPALQSGEIDMIVTTEAGPAEAAETLAMVPLVWVGAPEGQQAPLRIPAGRVTQSRPLPRAQAEARDTIRRGDEQVTSLGERYEALYGYRPAARPIEVESLRVVASSRPPEKGRGEPARGIATRRDAVPERRQRAYLGGGWREVAVYDGPDLVPGDRLAGPALVLDDYLHYMTDTMRGSSGSTASENSKSLRSPRTTAAGPCRSASSGSTSA